MRPIVHIGFHKTGTTWFQQSVYPRVANHAYVPRDRVARAFLTASAFRFDPSWSRELLELAANAPPILCEESLCGSPYTGGHMGLLSERVAQRIHALFPDARIVIFVRAQPSMIASTYLQYVRLGGTHASHRFLMPEDYAHVGDAIPKRLVRFSFDHFEYDRLVAHYAATFGAENVHVYAYEELRRDASAFLARFARDLALELPPVPMAKRNVSFSPNVARLARFLNHFTAHKVSDKRYWIHIPHWYALRKRVLERLNASAVLGGPVSPEELLGSAMVRFIGERYWESNRRLAALTGLDLSAFGYPLEPPPAPVPRPPGPRWRRWAVH